MADLLSLTFFERILDAFSLIFFLFLFFLDIFYSIF
jgi:hypothetical protein